MYLWAASRAVIITPVTATTSLTCSLRISSSETGSLISTIGHLLSLDRHRCSTVGPADVRDSHEVAGGEAVACADLHAEDGGLAAEAVGPDAQVVELPVEPLLERRELRVGV